MKKYSWIFALLCAMALIFAVSCGEPEDDTTAPKLSAGSVSRTSDTAATIGFTSDEAGTAFYSVVNSGAAAPANTAVKTSLGKVNKGANSGKAVVLTAGAKDIYVVVEDSSGNLSAALKIAAAAYVPGANSFNGIIFENGAFNPAANVEDIWDITKEGNNLVSTKDGGMNFNGDEGIDISGKGYTKLIVLAPGVNFVVLGDLWGDDEDIEVEGVPGLNVGWGGTLTFPLNDNNIIFGFMFTAFGQGASSTINITKIYFE